MKFKTEGLIIREQTVGESDRLVWILTRDEGVVRAFAHRAKNWKDSKNAATGLLCYSRMTLYRGKEAYTVGDAMPIDAFFGLREDLLRLALAQYFCSLAYETVPEGTESEPVLRLILNALHFLSRGERPPQLLKPIVELRMLSTAGYMPDLVGCQNCGKYEDERMVFKPGRGEIYCGDCFLHSGDTAVPVSRAALHAMRHIVYSDFEKVFFFQLAEEPLQELGRAAEEYTVHILQKRLGTLDFYNSLL